jgi:hypothetical protein
MTFTRNGRKTLGAKVNPRIKRWLLSRGVYRKAESARFVTLPDVWQAATASTSSLILGPASGRPNIPCKALFLVMSIRDLQDRDGNQRDRLAF